MNKLARYAFIVITSCIILSCNDDIIREGANVTPDPNPSTPISIVGLWGSNGLGVITDTQTIDATLADIKKTDAKVSDALTTLTFEFKADSTSNIPGKNGIATDAGKFKISSDKKTLIITSKTFKDTKGNPEVQTFDIVSLTATELKLGIAKLTQKDASGTFVVDFLTSSLTAYVFSAYVFAAKGLDAQKELNATKTLQTTYNLTKK